jgi:adenylate cyclase
VIDARAPAADADRRTASIVFADLSGFTALSEQLDPEDVRALQSDLIAEVSAAIAQHDGFIEKYIGDAVVAVFGAPVAHEDDPERALRSALVMCERVAQMSKRWERRLGTNLEIHVGVNTGPVVAGHVGAGASAAYAVTGDTVNTAARLQGQAGPSEILVSEQTWRLTRHAFSFESIGAVALKGKAEPVHVYRLTGVLASPSSGRGLELHGLNSPLVGRDAELDALVAAYDGMRQGRTQVVSLTGEPGAGKSRLLRELMCRIEADGRLASVAVRQAACSSEGEQTYGVFAALLRDAFHVAADDSVEVARGKLAAGFREMGADAAEITHLASLLGHVLGLTIDHEVIRHLEPDQVKRQLYHAALAAIDRRLELSPLLLIVEDLHWADAASLELIEFLFDRLADRRLMLLATWRETPGFHGVATSSMHTTLRLEPLTENDCEQLLLAWFGESHARLPDRARALLIERAGGNPLHLEELLRDLIERRILVQKDGQWLCTEDVDASDVPATLHGLLLSRVDRLETPVRQVLQEAAVIGHRFDLELLRGVTAERAQLEPVLDRLVDLQLLLRVDATDDALPARHAYAFRHGLLHETVYQNLLVRRRTELHTLVGEKLEQQVGAQPTRLEDVEALGHHWSLSSDKARGAQYLLAAGDWARDMYANEDALRHYRRALDTLGRCEAPTELLPAVNERLGDLLALAGDRAAANLHYQNALTCYQRANDAPAQARQWRRMAELHWSGGDRASARQHLLQGLELLEQNADAIEFAHHYQAMGRLCFRNGDPASAADWAHRAIAHAEQAMAANGAGPARTAAASALSLAHNTLGVAMARLDRMDDARQHLERSVEIAQENGLLQTASRGLANLGVLYSTLNPRRAIETCSHGLQMAKRIGDFALQSRLYANLAVAYCALTNRCDEHGIGAAQAAIDLDRRMGQLDHLTVPLIVLAQIYQCHGRPGTALQYYREALALAESAREPQLLFPCYDGLASLYLEAGDEAMAETYMLRAQAVCDENGVDPQALVVLPFLD